MTPFPFGPQSGCLSAHISQTAKGWAVKDLLDRLDGHPLSAEISAEISRLTVYADAQESKVRQLQTALDSRVAIERANGILAERFQVAVEEAFDLLRKAARSSRRELTPLAEEVISSSQTPTEIAAALP